jgi:acetyltransferase-like isoleucine patch superfamily enzyme
VTWRRDIDDALAVARAHWYLRKASHVGRRVRLRGRPVINAAGSIIVHDRVQLVSHVARLELGTGDGGVLEIGERTLVNYGCSIAAIGRVSIGERCLIGPHCMIIDSAFHDVDPDHRLDPPTAEPITIGNNVWLGARVIVLPGVTIGDDSVVGVGSIVTRDIPPRSLAVGAPARVVRAL